jgi:hypothetical protein
MLGRAGAPCLSHHSHAFPKFFIQEGFPPVFLKMKSEWWLQKGLTSAQSFRAGWVGGRITVEVVRDVGAPGELRPKGSSTAPQSRSS